MFFNLLSANGPVRVDTLLASRDWTDVGLSPVVDPRMTRRPPWEVARRHAQLNIQHLLNIVLNPKFKFQIPIDHRHLLKRFCDWVLTLIEIFVSSGLMNEKFRDCAGVHTSRISSWAMTVLEVHTHSQLGSLLSDTSHSQLLSLLSH